MIPNASVKSNKLRNIKPGFSEFAYNYPDDTVYYINMQLFNSLYPNGLAIDTRG